MAKAKERDPVVAFASKAAWARWLSTHHASSPGVLLRIAKKGTETPSLTYSEALDAALAWGWIDGRKETGDAGFWLQRFTRRGPWSPWSKLNRERALKLVAAGEMAAPGLAEVERAKKDGRWKDAYDGARTVKMPEDLARALQENARARAFFETIDAANRYAILYRVQTAKKPETRAERITRFVRMLAKHETIHPPRGARACK